MPSRFVVKNGLEDPVADGGIDPRTVVATDEPRDSPVRDRSGASIAIRGGRAERRARLDGVAQQVAERLAQQHLVAVHGRELARYRHDVAAARRGVGAGSSATRASTSAPRSTGASVSCAGRAKFRKLVTTRAERRRSRRGCPAT